MTVEVSTQCVDAWENCEFLVVVMIRRGKVLQGALTQHDLGKPWCAVVLPAGSRPDDMRDPLFGTTFHETRRGAFLEAYDWVESQMQLG